MDDNVGIDKIEFSDYMAKFASLVNNFDSLWKALSAWDLNKSPDILYVVQLEMRSLLDSTVVLTRCFSECMLSLSS